MIDSRPFPHPRRRPSDGRRRQRSAAAEHNGSNADVNAKQDVPNFSLIRKREQSSAGRNNAPYVHPAAWRRPVSRKAHRQFSARTDYASTVAFKARPCNIAGKSAGRRVLTRFQSEKYIRYRIWSTEHVNPRRPSSRQQIIARSPRSACTSRQLSALHPSRSATRRIVIDRTLIQNRGQSLAL